MEGKEATLLINTIAGVFHSMSESALSAQIKDIIYSFVTDGLDDCPFCEERFTRFKFGVSMPFGAKNVLAEGHYIECCECQVCTLHQATKEDAIKAWNSGDVWGEE